MKYKALYLSEYNIEQVADGSQVLLKFTDTNTYAVAIKRKDYFEFVLTDAHISFKDTIRIYMLPKGE